MVPPVYVWAHYQGGHFSRGVEYHIIIIKQIVFLLCESQGEGTKTCHPLLFKQTNVTLETKRSLLCHPPPQRLWLGCKAWHPCCGGGWSQGNSSRAVHYLNWGCEDLQGVVPLATPGGGGLRGGPMVGTTPSCPLSLIKKDYKV